MRKVTEFWCDYWHFICFGLYVCLGVFGGVFLSTLDLSELVSWILTGVYFGIGVIYCKFLGVL